MTYMHFCIRAALLALLIFVPEVGAGNDDKEKYQFTFYGYIKLDAAWDDSRVSTGNFARWVLPENLNEDDSEFNMTANQTRLGVRINGPRQGSMLTAARVEIDFYEGGAENKARPMMRHAYLTLSWPESGTQLLAGQTSDLISPLVPETVNYTVAWWVGNIGYRRPQVRLTQSFDTGNGTVTLAAALAREIGHDFFFDPGDTGEDSGIPSFQWRAGYSSDMLSVGASGHWGREEFDLTASGEPTEEIDSWSFNVDARLTLHKQFVLSGEFYTGENMDAYLGGIAQGVNLASLEAIESSGGWVAAAIGPFDNMRFNAGYAMDNPEDDQLPAGSRGKNQALWGNIFVKLGSAVQLAGEISHWRTEYVGSDEADALRLQGSFIFSF